MSAGSSWIGAVMHCAATSPMVVVTKKLYTYRGAIFVLAMGPLTIIILMIPLNLVLDIFIKAVKTMIITAIIPFNVFKTTANPF